MDFLVGTLTAFLPLPPLGTNLSASSCVMAEGVRDGFGVGHLASLQPFAIRLEPNMAAASRITHNPIRFNRQGPVLCRRLRARAGHVAFKLHWSLSNPKGESATHPPLALLALLAHFEEGLEKKRVLALT